MPSDNAFLYHCGSRNRYAHPHMLNAPPLIGVFVRTRVLPFSILYLHILFHCSTFPSIRLP
jgi:hypothetical protein